MHKVIQMNGNLLAKHVFTIIPGNFEFAGNASSSIKRILKQMGMEEEFIRRICVACYEVEMNMVIYSNGGNVWLNIYPDEIIVIAQDCGPGIPDVGQAMKDGYSTAPEHVLSQGFGAGRGFSNIKRYTDQFYIDSVLGKGTKLELHFKMPNTSNIDVNK